MRCAKNGTTVFAPVPDSVVLLSQVALRFVLVTFKLCIIMLIIIIYWYSLFHLLLQITVSIVINACDYGNCNAWSLPSPQ